MQNININDGMKEFRINNDPDRVIRFNPADAGIIERIYNAYKNISDFEATLTGDVKLDVTGNPVEALGQSADIVSRFKKHICEQIDYIFNSPVSDKVFGNQSPLSSVKGIPLYEQFLNAVIPVIQKELTAEKKASLARMNKYILQVKNDDRSASDNA